MTNDQSKGNDALPRVTFNLTKIDDPHDRFTPLAVPSKLITDLPNVTGDLIELAHTELDLSLVAGTYRLPVVDGEPLAAEVMPNCRMRWLATVHRGGNDRSMVTAVDISFEPALRLTNVWAVLAQLPSVFRDYDIEAASRQIERLLASDAATNAKKVASDWYAWLQESISVLAPEARRIQRDVGGLVGSLLDTAKHVRRRVEQSASLLRREVLEAGRLPVVELEKAAGRPVKTRRGWELELSFTGELGYPGATRRFEDVVLPRSVLPAPHALMESLLSETPLATAAIDSGRIDARGVAGRLASAVGSVEGRFELRGRPPLVELIIPTPSEGTLGAEVSTPDELLLKGRLSGEAKPDKIEIALHDLQLGDASRRIGANIDLVLETHGSCSAKHPDNHPDRGKKSSLPMAPVARRCVEAAFDGVWPHEDLKLAADVRLNDDSGLSCLELGLKTAHPLTRGETFLRVDLGPLDLSGRMVMHTGTEPQSLTWERTHIDFTTGLEVLADSVMTDGITTLRPTATQATLSGHAQSTDQGDVELITEASMHCSVTGSSSLGPFPELEIEKEPLEIEAEGRLEATGRARAATTRGNLLEIDLAGSSGSVTVEKMRLRHSPRTLSLPAGSRFEARVVEGLLDTTGLGRAHFYLAWDMDGRSPVLSKGKKRVKVFVPELRSGSLSLLLSEIGKVSITGRQKGLYDAHFFNALINPGSEPKRWMEILESDEAMGRVLATLRLFSSEIADLLERARRFAKKARGYLDREGITQPRDIIPAHRIARLISLLLSDSEELQERIYPLVKQVTDGEGLDIPETRKLLAETLPEHDYDFELDRILRIGGRLLAPTQPLQPLVPTEETPLAEDRRYLPLISHLPTATMLYAKLRDDAPLSADTSSLIARVAPYLTLEQLDYVSSLGRNDWDEIDKRTISTVRALKRRVRMISDSYGGIAFLPQAWAISFFIGEATRPRLLSKSTLRRRGSAGGRSYELADGLLGPEEVAVLLQSCLASFWQGEPVQINQRLLIDYIRRQPSTFLVEVLVEMAAKSTRALTGVLYALMQMEQSSLRDEIDMVNLISERTGVAVPRLADYMAGGRWARKSHYEAVTEAAQQILDEATPYLAAKARLQSERHPVAGPFQLEEDASELADEAKEAIREADRRGDLCTFDTAEPRRRAEAIEAYRTAFAACRRLLDTEPEAFQLDWVKGFWARNHEALTVLSVVRNVQQEIDQVPFWLETRLGRKPPEGEQDLVEAVIDVLYAFEKDRKTLKADPLVRLLIDPPQGEYDFTVVSCMGVITEGAKGTELIDTYRRLYEKRSVRVIRADTRTARSLDYNAARVEEAVCQVTTPWGYIGYSQGCANGLNTESRLLGGTPDQQRLVRGLRCRNLLFSAVNGSAHGTCGDIKFVRAMSDGDKFIKHYQAVFSRQAIEFALKNIRTLLDSRSLVHSLAGIQSLSHDGVRPLARDGQFKNDVPTSIVRGIVEPDILPEALEMLSNVLTKQIESTDHDTQVTITEAVGHPVWVRSPQAEQLARCDMGAMVQRTHHWSPLYHTTDFVTTDRDRSRAVYMFPKDRHVFPWIEVNARFGIIPRR
jgi:hypothetical protein